MWKIAFALLAAALAACTSTVQAAGPRPKMHPFKQYRSFDPLTLSSTVTLTATHKASVTPVGAAEYHCINKNRVFVITGSSTRENNVVQAYTITSALDLELVGNLSLTLPGQSEKFGEPNSCTAFDGKVYVVVTPFQAIGSARGKLMVYNATSLAYITSYDAGYNPDHVLQSPNKRFVVTADEGEPPQVTGMDLSLNQRGGATILDTQTGSLCSFQFDFSGYTDDEFAANRVHESLKADLNMTYDIEPEFVSFDPQDSNKAYLTCQEANVVVEIDLNPIAPCSSQGRVKAIYPLGWKDYRTAFPNNQVAPSDRISSGNDYNITTLPFSHQPLYGMYQPDGTKGFTVYGKTYFITANEGDSKDGDFFGTRDEANVGDLIQGSVILNPDMDWSPLAVEDVETDVNLKRLKVFTQEGRNATNSNLVDYLVAQGGRGFAIWTFDSAGTTLVYESGDSTEKQLQTFLQNEPTLTTQAAAFVDRARRKGSEPENTLVFNTPTGRPIALVAFERASTIGFYDVSDPSAPETIGYVSHPDLVGPEGISIIAPADSPSGKYLLVANGEGSGDGLTQRLMVWELVIAEPARPKMFSFPKYRSFNKLSPSTTLSMTATHKASVIPAQAAEYHCIDKNRVFVIAGSATRANNVVHVYNVTGSIGLELVGSLDLTIPGDSDKFGEPNSCTAVDGKVYVVVTPFQAIGLTRGKIMVYDAVTLAYIASHDAGYNPDHVLYSPNKRYIVTADEGEPPQVDSDPDMDLSQNQRGGATILDTQTGDVCSFQFDFSGYTDKEFSLNRVHESLKSDLNMTHDIEPEFVSFDPQDNSRAFLTCQEANVVIEIDIRSTSACSSAARVRAIYPLGWKDYRTAFPNNTIAPSDRSASGSANNYNINNLAFKSMPLYGMFQPDGTKGFTINGKTYFITANEGDSKDGDLFGSRDEANVGDLIEGSVVLNTEMDWSPLAVADVNTDGNLKRLKVFTQEGRNATDPNKVDYLVAQGGRGFAIWTFDVSTGTVLVYESGDSTEKELQAFLQSQPTLVQQTAAFLDRSRRKGSEPENTLVFNTTTGRYIALVAFERASTIGFYDVTNPAAPRTIGYVSHPDLVGPEGISIIAPADSPSGKYLLVSNGEGSGDGLTQRLMVWELDFTETSTSAGMQLQSTLFASIALLLAMCAVM